MRTSPAGAEPDLSDNESSASSAVWKVPTRRSRENFCQGGCSIASWVPGGSYFFPEEAPARLPPTVSSFPGTPLSAASGTMTPALTTAPRSAVFCATPGCREPSWNGRPGEYCSRSCKERAISSRLGAHTGVCAYGGCGRTALVGEFCSRSCEAKARSQSRQIQFQMQGRPSLASSSNGASPFAYDRQSRSSRADEPRLVEQSVPAYPATMGSMDSGRQPAKLEVGATRQRHTITTMMAGHSVKVIAFSFPGKEEVVDEICKAPFLGSQWDLGSGGLQIQAPSRPGDWKSFRNAEAAFMALQVWEKSDELADVSGEEAAKLGQELTSAEDFTYCGYGSSWSAMLAVLRQKFKSGSELADELAKTGQAFLLYHHSESGVDMVWSDNKDGSGTNWLGMQLMLVRDELRQKTGRWTKTVQMAVDVETGQSHSAESLQPWQQAVTTACTAVREAEDNHRDRRA